MEQFFAPGAREFGEVGKFLEASEIVGLVVEEMAGAGDRPVGAGTGDEFD